MSPLSEANTLVCEEQLPFTIANLPETFTKFRIAIEGDFDVEQPIEKQRDLRSGEQVSQALYVEGAISELRKLDVFAEVDCDSDTHASLEFRGGETQAWERLQTYIWNKDLLRTYKATRNGMLGGDYSSKFSPWLAHGCFSPRQIYHQVKTYESERVANDSTCWLIFELLWRDYFALMVAKHAHDDTFLPANKSVPNERIDGTQMPTKSPSSLCPLNQSPTENKNDANAPASISSFPRVCFSTIVVSKF